MRDFVALAMLVLGFATLVTAHLVTVVGVAARRGSARAAFAFAVPFLAPVWAVRGRMGVRAAFWIGGLVVYASGWVLNR